MQLEEDLGSRSWRMRSEVRGWSLSHVPRAHREDGCAEVRGMEELKLGRGVAQEELALPLEPSFGALLPQVLTALDRDASCRKHKLRQKLEQIMSLMTSNS